MGDGGEQQERLIESETMAPRRHQVGMMGKSLGWGFLFFRG